MHWLWPASSTGMAVAVWWDAHHLGIRYGGPSGRDSSLGAPGWALMTSFCWPIVVPLYLVRRRRWLPAARVVTK